MQCRYDSDYLHEKRSSTRVGDLFSCKYLCLSPALRAAPRGDRRKTPGPLREMAKVWQTVLAICRSPDLVPKHFPEEGDGAGEDFLFAAGDEMVFAVYFY